MSDEGICVASLFGLNLPEIVRTPNERRTRKILEMQQWFPPGIIFMNAERLGEEGFRWAPRSFIARQSTELALLHDEQPPACFNKFGLIVKYTGFLLNISRRPLCHNFIRVDERSESAYTVLAPLPPLNTIDINIHRHPTIISSRDPEQVPESVAIVVDVEREEDEYLYVRFGTRVIVRKEPTNLYDQHVKHFKYENDLDVDEYLYTATQFLPQGQQWCVG